MEEVNCQTISTEPSTSNSTPNQSPSSPKNSDDGHKESIFLNAWDMIHSIYGGSFKFSNEANLNLPEIEVETKPKKEKPKAKAKPGRPISKAISAASSPSSPCLLSPLDSSLTSKTDLNENKGHTWKERLSLEKTPKEAGVNAFLDKLSNQAQNKSGTKDLSVSRVCKSPLISFPDDDHAEMVTRNYLQNNTITPTKVKRSRMQVGSSNNILNYNNSNYLTQINNKGSYSSYNNTSYPQVEQIPTPSLNSPTPDVANNPTIKNSGQKTKGQSRQKSNVKKIIPKALITPATPVTSSDPEKGNNPTQNYIDTVNRNRQLQSTSKTLRKGNVPESSKDHSRILNTVSSISQEFTPITSNYPIDTFVKNELFPPDSPEPNEASTNAQTLKDRPNLSSPNLSVNVTKRVKAESCTQTEKDWKKERQRHLIRSKERNPSESSREIAVRSLPTTVDESNKDLLNETTDNIIAAVNTTHASLQQIISVADMVFSSFIINPYDEDMPDEEMEEKEDHLAITLMRMFGISKQVRHRIYDEIIHETEVVQDLSLGTFDVVGDLIEWIYYGSAEAKAKVVRNTRMMATTMTEVDPHSYEWEVFETEVSRDLACIQGAVNTAYEAGRQYSRTFLQQRSLLAITDTIQNTASGVGSILYNDEPSVLDSAPTVVELESDNEDENSTRTIDTSKIAKYPSLRPQSSFDQIMDLEITKSLFGINDEPQVIHKVYTVTDEKESNFELNNVLQERSILGIADLNQNTTSGTLSIIYNPEPSAPNPTVEYESEFEDGNEQIDTSKMAKYPSLKPNRKSSFDKIMDLKIVKSVLGIKDNSQESTKVWIEEVKENNVDLKDGNFILDNKY